MSVLDEVLELARQDKLQNGYSFFTRPGIVKEARAELARLRAAAAERDGMRDSLQAWSQLWAHICKRLGGDADLLPNESNFDGLFDDLRSWLVPNVTSQEKERTVTAQAAQLEQAQMAWLTLCAAIDDLHFTGTVDGLGRVADARTMWPVYNAPAPQEERTE